MTEPNKSLTEALANYDRLARQNAQALRVGASQLRDRAKAAREQAEGDDAQAEKLDKAALEELARLDRLRADLAPLAAGRECTPCEEKAARKAEESRIATEQAKALAAAARALEAERAEQSAVAND